MIIRGPEVLESTRRIDAVILDKTGTVTDGRMSLAQVSDGEWKVKKDGARFDYYAGATVTPRAVTKAVLKAVQWADAHRDRLFAEGVAQ